MLEKTKIHIPKIAQQHHQMTSNNLFTVGRAGLRRINDCGWKGSYRDINKKLVNYEIEAESNRTMNAFDQSVYFALLLLHRNQSKLDVVEGSEDPTAPSGTADLGAHLQLNISGYSIFQELDMEDSTKNYRRLTQSLNRLSKVHLTCKLIREVKEAKQYKVEWTSNLLHYTNVETPSGQQKLRVVMNSLLSYSAHRQNAQLHSSHCIRERNNLSLKAQILHAAICSRLRPGHSSRFTMSKIIYYLYSKKEFTRKEKFNAKNTVEDLGRCEGWKVYQEPGDVCKIHRPKLQVEAF